ncbi:hypothetical protein [Spiroplasma culicicola]|uniref:Uncharacterized protein n=1 Tax=Spiroplasma culicicola AES-1 TaxID=1276246 RepID=W6A6J3_9MOLU|nr:hypothetical protein [Spiroplasma culicicola]AHI52693.1 hypothetical protein SCULI_v1c03520 [Spiroplasma culicicola AES-1]
MKSFEKESIFWYGLHTLVKDNAQLKYYITTEKELINSLYALTYLGVFQYTLYRGIKLEEIPLEDTNEYVNYIIENLEELYKVRYRFVKEKPKKITLKDEETLQLAEDIIAGLLIPYINAYCFKKTSQVYSLNGAYLRESIINFEYDINHHADDGKLKTSMLYPFLFTLNLIKVFDDQGLYQRVLKYYQKDNLTRKYHSGREWKPKEIEYLQETFELIENDEEWGMFLSNFSISKWTNFDIKERFKALFQLTKVSTILMKDEISAVTMLGDGEEVYDMLENYLPIYIYNDKLVDSEGNLTHKIKNFDKVIMSPFSLQQINFDILKPYIESKNERHISVDFDKLIAMCKIVLKVFSEIRMLLLTHEYLPKVVDSQIATKKKLFVEILDIFEEVKDCKYKRKIDSENFSDDWFYISEDEINEVIEAKYNSIEDYLNKPALDKLGRIMTFSLSIETYTARTFDYSLQELLTYNLVIFGPHPLDHTVQTQETVQKMYDIFKQYCLEYENIKSLTTKQELADNLKIHLELPLKLLNWKKD